MSLPQLGSLATGSELQENKSDVIKSCSSSSSTCSTAEKNGDPKSPGILEAEKVNTLKDTSGELSAGIAPETESLTDNLGPLNSVLDKNKTVYQQPKVNASMPNKTAPIRRMPHLHKLEK